MAEKLKGRLSKSGGGISEIRDKDLDMFFKERGINIDEKISKLGMILIKHKMLNEKTARGKKSTSIKFEKIEFENAEILISAKLKGKVTINVTKLGETNEETKSSYGIACKGTSGRDGIELK